MGKDDYYRASKHNEKQSLRRKYESDKNASSSRHRETYHKNKRYRDDRSPENDRGKSSREKEVEDKEFSFRNYRYELNKVFSANPNLIQDLDDFWEFVRKYEAVKQKRGNASTSLVSPEFLKGFQDAPELCGINVRVNLTFSEIFAQVPMTKAISDSHLNRFQDVINLYLDFKQKEKFVKLKKLRDSQYRLPVTQFRTEIVETIKSQNVVIIAGDTGCGKSTQVPQYLYKAGFKSIGCTQPRRIACISLAKRVAFETLTENRQEVGYQIRFEKQRNQNTKITFITEGLLLRQVSSETGLSQYDVIVLDEVHERHLHGDFLLGIMKCMIRQRPDLKLVLMSATINIQLFSNYFANENVTVIQVPGRLFPIQLNYRPILRDQLSHKSNRFDPSPYVQILHIIDKKYPQNEKGDLLIFLSGMSEITAVVDSAKEYAQKKTNWIVLPLHSTLSIAEQDKVFDYPPDGVRKCIVSTNIAETSITIDGIRFVVDSGKVKEMSYDPICKMQCLKEFWISKASAEQRKGRAGRTGPGVCYRLYSEEEYTGLEKYSTPEIQRVPLDSLLLQMIAMGLPDSRKFPFIEPPPLESIENSILSLKDHGALTEDEKLTTIGKTLSKLPVDITIGKMLIMGSLFHQVEPVLSLAAALSVQNPFTNRAYQDTECETSRKSLESDHGDPIILLNAYKEWLQVKQESSYEGRANSSTSKKWCRRRGLEEQRFYELTKLRTQFKELLQDCGLLKIQDPPSSAATSTERMLRHGELKLLKSLKRTYKQTAPRKRKELKLDQFDLQFEDKDEEGEIDIKDIEFRMRNDSTRVQNLLDAATACSYKDLTMLKIILCSGLYPQFACADDFNYCKSTSEQLFHTKAKPYVALHPMSYFGNHPQVLQLEDPDIVSLPGYKSKTAVSPKHQLLAYLSLLETTKPYLVNTLRMPAAQTLLLFANDIDTNYTFSILVCDSWLRLEFPMPDSGQILLMNATRLRQKWDTLLSQRLSDTVDSKSVEEDPRKLENELNQELIQFMYTTVPYTIKRLLPADLKVIYVGSGENHIEVNPNPFQAGFECSQQSVKGGVRLTNNIVYNCLVETEWSDKLALDMMEIEWQCSNCDIALIATPIEKLQHQSLCLKSTTEDTKTEDVAAVDKKPNSRGYDCPHCSKVLYLTPIEILKHKKQHL